MAVPERLLPVVLILGLALGLGAWALAARGRQTSPSTPADASRLAGHVRMLAGTLSPRDEEHPENLDRVAAYIRQEFAATGARVEDQPFETGGRTWRNVIASYGPEAGERIVMGAHYDAAGPYPGADDNASGVAGLLELARRLGEAPPTARVDLVAYALEEPPYFGSSSMGSAVHAASLKRAGVRVRAMICLEMIGYFTDAPDSQRFPLPALKLLYPSRGNFIAVVGRLGQGTLAGRVKRRMRRATPLPVHSIDAPPALPGVDLSDHRNYWDAGYDAVMITDTAFYRNDNYHTARDTPETLDYERMAMVVEGVHAAVIAEAKRAKR